MRMMIIGVMMMVMIRVMVMKEIALSFTYLANFQIVWRLSYKVNRILQLKNIINFNKYSILNTDGVGQNKQPEMMLEPVLI